METDNTLTGSETFLRDKLAIQRTRLANQTTFLAFLRTSMYFLVAALSIRNLLDLPNRMFEALLFIISGILLIVGIINFFYQKNIIDKSGMNLHQ